MRYIPRAVALAAVVIAFAAGAGGPKAPFGALGVETSQAGADANRPSSRTDPPPATFGTEEFDLSDEAARYARGDIVVAFEPGTRPATKEVVLGRIDAEVETRVRKVGAAVVKVPPAETNEALASLRAAGSVDYAEREVVVEALGVEPNDMLWANQWGLKRVGLDTAWQRQKGSPALVVAVVDTGVDASHPDLRGALVRGYDFVNNDSDPADDHGHGTSAAGVLAARADNVEGQAGVCWNCSIMPVKALDANGTGTTSSVAAGIVWAVDHGAHVVNLSLGAPATTRVLTDAIEYAVAKGAVVVAAAGNAGTSTEFHPAAHPDVISVAATDAGDALYSWSNRGAWVQVAAPGCNPAPTVGGSYVEFCGTSSAAPIVAGLAALARSHEQGASRAEVEAAIRSASVPITDVQQGRIRADETLARILPPATVARIAFRGRLTPLARTRRHRAAIPGGRVVAQLTAATGQPLTLTLVGPKGRAVARVAGRSRLRLARTPGAGTYVLVVSTTRAPAAYSLRLEHSGAAAAGGASTSASERSRGRDAPPAPVEPQQTMLSPTPVAPTPAPGEASLGAPARPDEIPFARLEVKLSDIEQLEPAIVAEINRVRATRRLRPLAGSRRLAGAGDAHARVLALSGLFTHDWPDGRPFGRWIGRHYPGAGFPTYAVGENLVWASGELSARQAVQLWLASPGHRRIMLSPRWREIGVGAVHARGAPGVYAGHDATIAAAEFGVRR